MLEATRRICVAMDEISPLEAILARLRALGHEVVLFSYVAALEQLHGDSGFHLLLVDIEPPSLAGFEVIRRFRSLNDEAEAVLAVSGSFKRDHIEGMLENVGVRRLLALDAPVEEFMFWINHALFPEQMRSRKTPRLPASFVLSVAGRRRVLRGRAFNLSEEGVFLETNLAAAPGETVELRFRLPGQSLRRDGFVVRCMVIWANPKRGSMAPPGAPCGLGLRFLDLDAGGSAAIKTYVMEGLLESTI